MQLRQSSFRKKGRKGKEEKKEGRQTGKTGRQAGRNEGRNKGRKDTIKMKIPTAVACQLSVDCTTKEAKHNITRAEGK